MACECKGLCDNFKDTYKRPGEVGYTQGRKDANDAVTV